MPWVLLTADAPIRYMLHLGLLSPPVNMQVCRSALILAINNAQDPPGCALQVTYRSVPSTFGSKHWPRRPWGQVTGVICR